MESQSFAQGPPARFETVRRCVHALAFMLCLLPGFGAVAQQPIEITITSPVSDETVHDSEGNVSVAVSIAGLPAGTGATFRALVDGTPQGPDRMTSNFMLEGLARGEHVLQVLLVDGRGAVLAASPGLTFHVWRASALFPGRQDRPPGRVVP
jgi:hypothetical protein